MVAWWWWRGGDRLVGRVGVVHAACLFFACLACLPVATPPACCTRALCLAARTACMPRTAQRAPCCCLSARAARTRALLQFYLPLPPPALHRAACLPAPHLTLYACPCMPSLPACVPLSLPSLHCCLLLPSLFRYTTSTLYMPLPPPYTTPTCLHAFSTTASYLVAALWTCEKKDKINFRFNFDFWHWHWH